MKKVKAFTVSTPLTITTLVVLICVGAYLAYAISVVNNTNNSNTTTTTKSTQKTNDTKTVEQSDAPTVSEPTNPTDATANWQTYTNSKYGYVVKYPTEFDMVNTLYDRIAKQRTYQDKWVFIDKNKIGTETYLDGGDWPQPYFEIVSYDQELESLSINDPNSIETEITFVGEKAIKTILTKPDDFGGQYLGEIRLNHNGKGFVISWRNTDAQNSHDLEVDQILSTFEFTK